MNGLKTLIAGLVLANGLVPVVSFAAEAPNLALEAARDYEARARFPEGSRPIAAGENDPILARRAVTKQTLPGPNGAAPSLSVWASGLAFQAGQAVDLFAELTDTSGEHGLIAALKREQRLGASSVTAQLLGEKSGQLAELTYRDDGEGADVRAGDGIYSARLTLPADRQPALGYAENVMVKVRALLSDGGFRSAVGGFLYSNPSVRLTGGYRETMAGGSLRIGVELEVLAPGRVHIQGTLADLPGAPVAFAQTTRHVETGRQWLDLPYYGLIFRDRGTAGPFRLSSITVSSVNDMPNALGPVAANAFVTQAHPLADFTAQPFNDPQLLDAARRLKSSQ